MAPLSARTLNRSTSFATSSIRAWSASTPGFTRAARSFNSFRSGAPGTSATLAWNSVRVDSTAPIRSSSFLGAIFASSMRAAVHAVYFLSADRSSGISSTFL